MPYADNTGILYAAVVATAAAYLQVLIDGHRNQQDSYGTEC